jgi:Ner family transcriptional regulator
MDALNNSKKTAQADWHRADIVAALHKKGWSLRQLSVQNGFAERTLNGALERPYLKAEKIIAQAIGLAPESIWPERYAKRNFTPVLTLITSQSSQSLQCVAA